MTAALAAKAAGTQSRPTERARAPYLAAIGLKTGISASCSNVLSCNFPVHARSRRPPLQT
jgi:hypothetical protein